MALIHDTEVRTQIEQRIRALTPDSRAKKQYDFETEHKRLLEMIALVTARPIDGEWPRHPAFGNMTGKQVSTLTHKHLNHHLTQFGV